MPLKSHTPRLRAIAIALAASAALAAPLSAQSNPPGFSLPEPTPTPTSAPQGPVDIRDGVVIGPRRIPAETPTPSPAPTQTPAPSPAESPTPLPAQTSAPAAATASPAPAAARSSAPSAVPPTRRAAPGSSAPTAGAPSAVTAGAPSDTQVAEPGFDDDAFYTAAPAENIAATPPAVSSRDAAPSAFAPTNSILMIALAALIILLGGIALVFLRRRKTAAASPSLLPAPALAAGVRNSIVEMQKNAAPVASEPATAPQPRPVAAPLLSGTPRMALRLDIASATRSMMMITVDYRLTLANRGDRALRDLAVSAKLVCARRNAAMPADSGDQPLQLVERIGPHQSRTIKGTVQLPIAEISPLRQGDTPLLVPLIEMKIEASGQPAKTHKFVLGLPSATNSARLHPIPLNTAPGGIPGMRANEVKDAAVR